MKKALFAALLAIVATAAQAATRQAIESSAVVNGTLVLAKDGTVQAAVIDDPAQYGQPIANLVHNAALQWRFQPVLRDGEPVVAKSSLHARVVLKQMPDGNYSARIKGVTFGDDDANSTDELQYTKGNVQKIPHYPEAAISARVQGTVYLSVHVDRTGHVVQAAAEQVNLDDIGPDAVLRQYREILAKASLDAARKWTFVIPTTGRLAKRDNWTAHIPVTFRLKKATADVDDVWQTYVPGPYTPAPWIDKPDVNAVDAVAGEGVRTDGAGPTLLTPLDHG